MEKIDDFWRFSLESDYKDEPNYSDKSNYSDESNDNQFCNTLDEFKLDTPNLSVFEYEGDMVSFSSNALALSETSLCLNSVNVDNQWFVKFIELLAKLNHGSNVLNLECYAAAIIPRELREILSPPLTYENHVCLAVDSEYNTFSFAKLVDSLLWVSPRAETVSIKYNDCDHEFSFQPGVYILVKQ
ncbi:hypothetical protein CISIN_1g046687mg [Citrus sinensis]|uniref:Uncharacterized protein n=1 Tax=Citrus sinensis TaxID=2711 RepID=A0A067DBC0_CITSI|nr:hypothetical protein CISIN_1g046687mg [Citrus sinensis]